MTRATQTTHTGPLTYGHHGLEVCGEVVDDEDLVQVSAYTLHCFVDAVRDEGKKEGGAQGRAQGRRGKDEAVDYAHGEGFNGGVAHAQLAMRAALDPIIDALHLAAPDDQWDHPLWDIHQRLKEVASGG